MPSLTRKGVRMILDTRQYSLVTDNGQGKLTYQRHRGYHHWLCLVCGKRERERIPDKANSEYQHNPTNPFTGVCGGCNGGSASARIRLNGHSPSPKRTAPDDGDDPLSYARLDGDWGLFYKIARYFHHKVKFEDREDFLHDLMVEMAKVKAKYQAKAKPLTEAGLMRVSSYELTEYWSNQRMLTSGLDCKHCSTKQRRKCREDDLYSDCPKAKHFLSLNEQVSNDGKPTELWETLADDKAIDLDAWVDDRAILRGLPRRLIEVAYKKVNGKRLSEYDSLYLNRFWKKAQKSLLG